MAGSTTGCRRKLWTEEECRLLLSLKTANSKISSAELATKLKRSRYAVKKKLQKLCKTEPISQNISNESRPSFRDRASQAALTPPVDTRDKERIRELEAEIGRLRLQLSWAQHQDSPNRIGGLLTLRASDHHYGDAQHLLSCGKSLESKFLEVVKQYEPDKIQIIAGDDWIAGRGIYKEQDLDMVTSDVNEQVSLGALKAYEFLLAIREITKAPIIWRVMRGNHDYAQGLSMTESLFYAFKNLSADIPDLNFVMHWDSITANLAGEGIYNVLVKHGFGYSKHSPNSPSFIDAVKDEIIVKQRKMQPEEQYKRVLSGHSHFMSEGLERIVGLPFDTTGGLQRNVRIKLGSNQRPVGWIAYASPKGLVSDILKPITLAPDEDTFFREMADPHLSSQNKEDAAKCVRKFFQILEERGDYSRGTDFGVVNVGRW